MVMARGTLCFCSRARNGVTNVLEVIQVGSEDHSEKYLLACLRFGWIYVVVLAKVFDVDYLSTKRILPQIANAIFLKLGSLLVD